VRALRRDPNVELLVAGRRKVPVPAADDVPGVLVDIDETGLVQRLKALSPGLVIHCVGPFQDGGETRDLINENPLPSIFHDRTWSKNVLTGSLGFVALAVLA
jgi:hypothetical protein